MPVVQDVRRQTAEHLRAAIAAQKQAAHRRETPPAARRDRTRVLSKFGTLAGRYSIPCVLLPSLAIRGAGKLRHDAEVADGIIATHRREPLTLSFDHCCVTGGEACRCLAALRADLEKSN